VALLFSWCADKNASWEQYWPSKTSVHQQLLPGTIESPLATQHPFFGTIPAQIAVLRVLEENLSVDVDKVSFFLSI